MGGAANGLVCEVEVFYHRELASCESQLEHVLGQIWGTGGADRASTDSRPGLGSTDSAPRLASMDSAPRLASMDSAPRLGSTAEEGHASADDDLGLALDDDEGAMARPTPVGPARSPPVGERCRKSGKPAAAAAAAAAASRRATIAGDDTSRHWHRGDVTAAAMRALDAEEADAADAARGRANQGGATLFDLVPKVPVTWRGAA